MAQDVATLGMVVDDSADWNPPPVIPLNLRSHLGKFGIGNDDLVVIEGLPEGAELSVGVCKPDGSWSVRAAEFDNAAFIPLYENGETYTVKVCLLTPDPSDHGLPKTKGKAQFTLKVPLAPLPVLEAFEDVAPKKKAAPATEAVIILGADPTLKASASQPAAAAPVAAVPQPIAPPQPAAIAPPPAAPAPPPAAAAPVAPAPQPIAVPPPAAAAAPIAAPAPAAAPAPIAAPPTIDVETHFAALRTEWQTNVKTQIAAAEKRLKAAHLQQLSKIQTVLAQEEATRTSAIAAKWKSELERRATEAEAELKARAKEHLSGLEARVRSEAPTGAAADFDQRLAAARQQWQVEEAARLAAVEAEWSAAAAMMQGSTAKADPAAVERAVAEARAAWEIEEGARRAKDAADLAAAHQRQVAQLEAQYTALYEMRMASAETAWRKAETERLTAAELAWSKREAERMVGVEAKWRSDHDKRLEVVLANLDTMVKGQLGNLDGSQPLPAIEPALASPAQPDSPQAHDDSAGTAAAGDDIRWRKTAAA
jgi:hypothetical protein